MKYIKLLLVIFLLLFSIVVRPIYADSFSLSLNPEKNEIITKPGQTITLPYSLTNIGDPQVVSFNIYSLQTTNNSKQYELLPYKNNSQAPQFDIINSEISMNKPFLMNSKSTVLFDVEITIPENVQRKDYYTTLVAEADTSNGEEGTSSIQLKGGVGSHILLTVTDSGQIDQSGQITMFTIPSVPSIRLGDNQFFLIDRNKPIPFAVTVTNTGDNYLSVSGKIGTASTDMQNLPRNTILASSSRTISSLLKPDAPIFSKKIFGLDTLSATMQIGNSQVLYANAHLIVLPIKTFIVLGIFIFLSIGIYTFITKKKWK